MALIEVTADAAGRLRELEAASGKIARLDVNSSGCSGLRYAFSQVDAPMPGDEVVPLDGASLAVAAKALLFVAGTRIDWVVDGLSRSFSFANPNETARCGCGESFKVGGGGCGPY